MAKLTPEEIAKLQQMNNREHARSGGKPNPPKVEENKKWARAGTTGHKAPKIEKKR
ncbi:hypothetical protein AB0L70_07650 [Kribbella sp. NPDC051952]|uniref:hypothetical protein n=1 Tax=Kribbella sp. NPDC051952 TaxID=3154851 RepID=UPI003417A3C2